MTAPDQFASTSNQLLPNGSRPHMTPCMDRPCVARAILWWASGPASMYPASSWSFMLLRAMMGISAHSFSLADRPVTAFGVSRSRMRQQTVAPSLRSLSQTSVGSSSCSSSTSFSVLRRRRAWLRSGARQRARSRRYGPACWQAPQPERCGAGVWTPPRARGRSCAWASFRASAE